MGFSVRKGFSTPRTFKSISQTSYFSKRRFTGRQNTHVREDVVFRPKNSLFGILCFYILGKSGGRVKRRRVGSD